MPNRPAGTAPGHPTSTASSRPAGTAPARLAETARFDDSDDEPSVFTPRASRPIAGGSARDDQGAGATPVVPEGAEPVSPPPPPASARFPDAPPRAARPGRRDGSGPAGRPAARAGQENAQPGASVETPSETTARLRPVPSSPPAEPTAAETTARLRPIPGSRTPRRPGAGAGAESRSGAGSVSPASVREASAWSPLAPAHPAGPDPALSWSAGAAARPVVSFGQPEAFEEPARHRVGPRTAAAAACLVLGLGLIGGAVTGSWLTGDGGDDATVDHFTTAATLWHSVPVDQLFPPTVQGTGAGPGSADRTWTRIAVAPDSGCAHAFDPLLQKVLAPVGCQRLLRATYTDATQSYVTTVGLLFTKADPAAMTALAARFRTEGLARRTDLMPRPYAAEGTLAASFGDKQRASWSISVLTDAPVVAYAVSGWADGRTVDEPQPAADAVSPSATTAPAQAGLGNEAQGLADRIERRLRQHLGTATEKPS
ncbi:hypothetical protein ACH47Z_10575 [Streptomyces sp. NPDC020192]|uniref:hypothetical protein n=1 Tax=Streptomyces sp. NPDC020192 TaxID=3365066 RepID=UPI00379E2718